MQPLIDRILGSDGALSSALAAAFMAIGFVLRSLFAARSKIIWGAADANQFVYPQQPSGTVSVFTATFLIRNVGRKSAENLQITFDHPPQHFEADPHMKYEMDTRHDGRVIISFRKLHAKEVLRLSLISVGAALPGITDVRCDSGQGVSVSFSDQRVVPHWVRIFKLLMIAVGVFTTLFLLARISVHLIS